MTIGSTFQEQEFRDFAIQFDFRYRRIPLLWSEANGEAERIRRTLNKYLCVSFAEDQNWKSPLLLFPCQYKATLHNANKVSPFQALTASKINIGLHPENICPYPFPHICN